MPDNDAITKADLQNVVVQLTHLVNDMAAKIIAETDRRFAETQNETNKRFHRADQQRIAFHKEVGNRFLEIEGKIMNRFDMAQEHTDDTVAKLSREVTTKLDRQAGVTDTFRLEQMTMGVVQDEIRADLETTKKKHATEINPDFPFVFFEGESGKRRVTVLEEEVLPSSNNKS